MSAQLQFPIFKSPNDTSHARGCCCLECKVRIAGLYGKTA